MLKYDGYSEWVELEHEFDRTTVCVKPCELCGEPVANERETVCERCKEFWMNMINRKCNTCRYYLKSTTMCVGCKHHPLLKDMYTPVGGE